MASTIYKEFVKVVIKLPPIPIALNYEIDITSLVGATADVIKGQSRNL